MAFLELKGIGKIYVSEGSVGVGIRGVDLSFERNEFVAITGESGSGKSTLLNVISGMDTYEEGEMYIEGEPTSHYIQQDFEEYRKKYISFIFQDYNIIDSMTVLQNVELSLMHIEDPKMRREKAIELLTRVGLENHLHHKGSHLSGGQKKRTVIARALSKDSPIILADEPTGNLDSKSSAEIMELLYEVSKDKLVIVVTHSFDEIAPYATRHIRVFDGAIESDQQIKAPKESSSVTAGSSGAPAEPSKDHSLRNGLILGRVRYFAKPKLSVFISLMLVLATIVVTAMSSMFGDIPEIFEKPTMFTHMDGRVVIARKDGAVITGKELEEIAAKTGAKSYLHYDYLLDMSSRVSYDTNVKPDVGRLPEADNEVLLILPVSEQPTYGRDEILYNKYPVSSLSYTVVGLKYIEDNRQGIVAVVTESGFKVATALAFFNGSDGFTMEIDISGTKLSYYGLGVSFDLAEDEYSVCDENFKAALAAMKKRASEDPGFEVKITSTLKGNVNANPYRNYYSDRNGFYIEYDYYVKPADGGSTVDMTLDDYKLIEAASYEMYGGYNQVTVSPKIVEDYMEKYFYPASYTQASLFYSGDGEAHTVVKQLEDAGYIAVPSDTTVKSVSLERLGKLFLLGFELVIWALIILFIAMLLGFVTTKAMGANAGEIGIMRSMGIPVKVIKISIYVQTLISMIPAYTVMILFAALIFKFPATNAMFDYLYWYQYLIIALSILVIDLRLSRKYVKKIFGTTVKKTLKGDDAG